MTTATITTTNCIEFVSVQLILLFPLFRKTVTGFIHSIISK